MLSEIDSLFALRRVDLHLSVATDVSDHMSAAFLPLHLALLRKTFDRFAAIVSGNSPEYDTFCNIAQLQACKAWCDLAAFDEQIEARRGSSSKRFTSLITEIREYLIDAEFRGTPTGWEECIRSDIELCKDSFGVPRSEVTSSDSSEGVLHMAQTSRYAQRIHAQTICNSC